MARPKLSEDARALKREDILDAAMTVFEQQGGIEALSFRKLAVEMGLSYSAPYRYFANKAELVDALRARAFRWIEKAMIQEIRRATQCAGRRIHQRRRRATGSLRADVLRA